MRVTIRRESEWDDYARAEATAFILDERRTCKRCGQFDSFQALDNDTHVGWEDGRKYTVRQFRCLGCGALDLVERDQREATKKHEDVTGRYSPGDGLRMTVEPMREGGVSFCGNALGKSRSRA